MASVHRRHRAFSTLDAVVIGAVILGFGTHVVARSRPVGNPRVPEPAKPVELSRYLGRWCEIARFDSRFERDCEGVTAEYSLRPDGMIQVLNTCRMGSPEGRARTVEGKAKIVQGSGNAKLKVSFFGPFFFGDYWVLDHAEDYSWSIVGEPTGKYLWILCREAKPADPIKEMLMARAAGLGYDTSLLRMTRQAPT
jgi:apolipoprotein D and lipocalin family protein